LSIKKNEIQLFQLTRQNQPTQKARG